MSKNELEDMMNIGPAMANNLKAVGVHTREQLRKETPRKVYERMQKKGLNVCRMSWYALEGALTDTNAIEIARIMKEQ